MKYLRALEYEEEHHICPFCDMPAYQILEKKKWMIVTPARAPYHAHHILIVPQRHVYLLQELSKKEQEELFAMAKKWAKRLHTKHDDVVLYMKDSRIWWPALKSVDHLHFHLIPDCPFGANVGNSDRPFFDAKTFTKIIAKIKKAFL